MKRITFLLLLVSLVAVATEPREPKALDNAAAMDEQSKQIHLRQLPSNFYDCWPCQPKIKEFQYPLITNGWGINALSKRDRFGEDIAYVGTVARHNIGVKSDNFLVGVPGYDGNNVRDAGGWYLLNLESNGTVEAAMLTTYNSFPKRAGAGSAVEGIGDFDNNGYDDYIIGAPGDTMIINGKPTATGAIYFYLNDSIGGGVTNYFKVTPDRSLPLKKKFNFGSGLANLGDIDNNGVTDLAVGCDGYYEKGVSTGGAVFTLLMNSDGSVKSYNVITNNLTLKQGKKSMFGHDVSAIGDLDGNGVSEIVVGMPGYSSSHWHSGKKLSGAGSIQIIFLNSDGSVMSRTQIDNGSSSLFSASGRNLVDGNKKDGFGTAVEGAGDLDQDGIPDITVGIPGSDYAGRDLGLVRSLHLNSDGSVKSSRYHYSLNTLKKDNFGAGLGIIADSCANMLVCGATAGDGPLNRDIGSVFVGFSNFYYRPYVCCDSTFVDPRDGKTYRSQLIGNQCWMIDNLDYGSMVDGIVNQSDDLIPEKYCKDNNSALCDTFGGMYMWPELMQYSVNDKQIKGSTQGVCPPGWHVPTDAEWKELEKYLILNGYNYDSTLTGDKIGKSMADTTSRWRWSHLLHPGAISNLPELNNRSGFTGKPIGFRYSDGSFEAFGETAAFWSATEGYDPRRLARTNILLWQQFDMLNLDANKTLGYSCRCVKD